MQLSAAALIRESKYRVSIALVHCVHDRLPGKLGACLRGEVVEYSQCYTEVSDN